MSDNGDKLRKTPEHKKLSDSQKIAIFKMCTELLLPIKGDEEPEESVSCAYRIGEDEVYLLACFPEEGEIYDNVLVIVTSKVQESDDGVYTVIKTKRWHIDTEQSLEEEQQAFEEDYTVINRRGLRIRDQLSHGLLDETTHQRFEAIVKAFETHKTGSLFDTYDQLTAMLEQLGPNNIVKQSDTILI